MEKWLVTGAAGFIGSNLCAYLMERGLQVVGLDNFATGKRRNIERLQARGGAFQFVEGDILDRDGLGRVIQGCSVVVHLAAQVSVQRSMDDPHETNAINVTGFLNVLTAAAKAGVRRFVYASSCAVYGDNPDLPLGESSKPRPLSPYAASKLINEHYATSLGPVLAPMETVGLRFFNVFGPWQDHAGGYAAVIPRWIDLCMGNKAPLMYGDGSASRDFCFVGDVCAAIAAAAAPGSAVANGVCNVGSGRPTTLMELFQAIRTELRTAGVEVGFDTPDCQPWRAGDIVHSLADVQSTKRLLGFVPSTDLCLGIRHILKEQYGVSG